jgi:hypothetical protein
MGGEGKGMIQEDRREEREREMEKKIGWARAKRLN